MRCATAGLGYTHPARDEANVSSCNLFAQASSCIPVTDRVNATEGAASAGVSALEALSGTACSFHPALVPEASCTSSTSEWAICKSQQHTHDSAPCCTRAQHAFGAGGAGSPGVGETPVPRAVSTGLPRPCQRR